MKNKDPKRVTILSITDYRDAKILIQSVDNLYQFIIYYKGEFRSNYRVINSKHKLTHLEMEAILKYFIDFAQSAMDVVIAQQTGEDLTKTHEREAAIVEELDKAMSKTNHYKN